MCAATQRSGMSRPGHQLNFTWISASQLEPIAPVIDFCGTGQRYDPHRTVSDESGSLLPIFSIHVEANGGHPLPCSFPSVLDRSYRRKRIALLLSDSANDLFSNRIEESHFFQIELDRHLLVWMEDMFAMDSRDQVTGT
jgi:hypothetical protein